MSHIGNLGNSMMTSSCPKCGAKVQLPRNTPPFGTSLTCRKCHASLIPVYEPDPGCPLSTEPSDGEAFFGYSGCSLEHPRCPWCQEINYSVLFPELGDKVSWYANRQQENPQANFVIKVECIHCNRIFVIEWDAWPFASIVRCNYCSATGTKDQFRVIPENRREEFERALGHAPATLAYLRDDHGAPLWVACSICLKVALTNRKRL